MDKPIVKVVFLSLIVLVIIFSFASARENHPPSEPLVVPLNRSDQTWKMKNLQIGKPGGQISYTSEKFPKTFNHLAATTPFTTDFTSMIMGSGLTGTNPVNGRVVPGLAKSWEISNDGLIYTFHLRKGLKFSDGKPLTGEDVIFTYKDLIFSQDVETEFRSVLEINGKLPRIKQVDKLTIQFTLPTRYGPFLRLVSTGIYPKHRLQDFNPKNFEDIWNLDEAAKKPQHIVGAGPFKLEEYLPQKRITMKRNPYYYKVDPKGTQLPYIDGYTVTKVDNNDVEFLKFTDGSSTFLKPQIKDMPFLLKNAEENSWKIIVGKGDRGDPIHSDFLTFNWNTEDNQLKNLFRKDEFRRAVSLAIDRKKIINESFNSFGRTQLSPVPSVSAYYNPSVEEFFSANYDLEKARTLLNRLGISDLDDDGLREFADGSPVKFQILTNEENEARIKMGKEIVGGLDKVGLSAKLELVPFETLIRKLQSGQFQAGIISVLINHLDPTALADLYTTYGSLNLWTSGDNSTAEIPDWQRKVNEAFRQGRKCTDFSRRKKYYDRFQVLFAKHLPVVYLAGETFMFVTKDSVHNTELFNKTGTFQQFAEYIWLEERK